MIVIDGDGADDATIAAYARRVLAEDGRYVQGAHPEPRRPSARLPSPPDHRWRSAALAIGIGVGIVAALVAVLLLLAACATSLNPA